MIFIALLRAVNVGGTGKLPMSELAAMCTDLGFGQVRTYIQSGNVVFESKLSEEKVQKKLEQVLEEKMGKPIDVLIRTSAELQQAREANPFRSAPPAKVAVYFLSKVVPGELLDGLATPGGEEVRARGREIYIHYPNGMGQSKLKLPPKVGPATARNLNTVAKLVALATAINS